MTDLPMGSWYLGQGEQVPRPWKACFKLPWRTEKGRIGADHRRDKKTKLQHELFKRIQYFKLGKRQIAFFEPLEL